jgi:hypothetical protein
VQVGKRSAYAPRLLRRFYNSIAVFQLESSSVVHPACYNSTPFNLERNQFIGSIVVVSVLAVLTVIGTLNKGPSALLGQVATLRRMCMSVLTIMYPMQANAVFEMINCR